VIFLLFPIQVLFFFPLFSIVGRAAFTGSHQWILLNNFTKDAYPPQVWSWLSAASGSVNMLFFFLEKFKDLEYIYLWTSFWFLCAIFLGICWGTSPIFSWNTGLWFSLCFVFCYKKGFLLLFHDTWYRIILFLQTVAVIPVLPHGVVQLGSFFPVSPFLLFCNSEKI